MSYAGIGGCYAPRTEVCQGIVVEFDSLQGSRGVFGTKGVCVVGVCCECSCCFFVSLSVFLSCSAHTISYKFCFLSFVCVIV